MQFTNRELETTFELPDAPDMRLVLRYDSVVEANVDKAALYERLWNGAALVVQHWSSPHIQPSDSLERAATPRALAVVKWCGLAVFSFMLALKDVDPNS